MTRPRAKKPKTKKPPKKSAKRSRRRPPKAAPAPRMRRQKLPPSGQGPVTTGPIAPDIGALDTDDDPVPE